MNFDNKFGEYNYTVVGLKSEMDLVEIVNGSRLATIRDLPDGAGVNFVINEGLCIWRTDLIKGYQWKNHAGAFSGLFGEWGQYLINKGFKKGVLLDYYAYHSCLNPFMHLGREESAWRKKAEFAPKTYNMSYADYYAWYQKAKDLSGWGSGIPDVSEYGIDIDNC